MAGEEVVGGIVGFLGLDADEFMRTIDEALLKIKALSATDAKVHVEATGVSSTERDLLKVAGAAKMAGGNVDKLGQSVGEGGALGRGPLIIGGIGAALALIGPVAGAATAALGGFVGVAGTAALAYVGFKDAITKGTALGQYLQGQLQGIKAEFVDLGKTAASAMSQDVLSGLSEIRRFLPTIDPEVEALAGHLGRAFSTSATGVVSGLQTMMPLLLDGGRYAEVMANKFADFAKSQDFKDFVAYAQRELPHVVDMVTELTGAIVSMGKALGPTGDELIKSIGTMAKAFNFLATAAGPVLKVGFWSPFKTGTDESATGLKAATDAVDEHTSHLLTLQQIQSPLAAAMGVTDQALADMAKKHQDNANAAKAAAAQMMYENDAAGLLKAALDKLNGKAISSAQAQNSFDSALANSNKHIAANGKTIDRATTSLKGNSAAAVANRGELIAQVTAAEGVATAMRDNGASTDETRKKMVKMRDQIIKNADAHGLDKAAVEKFIDAIYKIPKKVPPTRLEVQTKTAMDGIAAFQKAINALQGKSVTASVHYAYTGTLPNGGKSTAGGLTFKDGGKIPGYAGGTIVGPGTGTSDSILGMVAQTNRLLRVSAGEFISTNASRQRNAAALEAGNKGATLTVTDGGGRTVELGATTIAAIAAAVSRVNVKTSVSARDIGSALVVGV